MRKAQKTYSPETTRSRSKDVSPVRTYGLGTEPAPFLVFKTVICHMEGTCNMAAENNLQKTTGLERQESQQVPSPELTAQPQTCKHSEGSAQSSSLQDTEAHTTLHKRKSQQNPKDRQTSRGAGGVAQW